MSEYNTNQCFIELSLPPNHSKMKTFIEYELNEESPIEVYCSACKENVKKAKKMQLLDCDDAKFLIVVLSRGFQTSEGFVFLSKKVDILDEISIR